MRSGVRWAALATALLVLAGCSSSAPVSGAASLPPIQFVPQSPTEAPEPSEGQSGSVAGTCPDAVKSAVDSIVSQQLAAFKARDFDAAFALASEQFRAITNAEGLKALILKGHPEVADSVSHEFSDCRQPNPGLVLGAVSVTGENGKTVLLVYQFTLEDGTWHILQSAPMDGHGGGSELTSDPAVSGDV